MRATFVKGLATARSGRKIGHINRNGVGSPNLHSGANRPVRITIPTKDVGGVTPAYRERVYTCPAQNGRPGWVVEFPLWWYRGEFFEKFGGRGIDTGNPFRADDGLLSTQRETIAWDRHSSEAFARDPRSREAPVIEAMCQLETVPIEARWVIAESCEWKSGME